jgi:3-isopropylmalate/(R)-2-methylmalate dehydratase small subunit
MAKVILKLGDDVATDIIYPGRYMATVLPGETPQYAFADLPVNQRLRAGEISPVSIVIAGKNFGCGSSREQAASCLKGWGLRIIAPGFARIFMQNAINLGLELIVCAELEAEEGDEVEIAGGEVINHTSGRRFKVSPLPEACQRIINAGGLIQYTRQILVQSRDRGS